MNLTQKLNILPVVTYIQDDLEDEEIENMLESLVKGFQITRNLRPLSYYLIYNLQMEDNMFQIK